MKIMARITYQNFIYESLPEEIAEDKYKDYCQNIYDNYENLNKLKIETLDGILIISEEVLRNCVFEVIKIK